MSDFLVNLCFATLQLELLWGDFNLPSGEVVILPRRGSGAERAMSLFLVLTLTFSPSIMF